MTMYLDEINTYNYGNYSSDNYGSCRAVRAGPVVLYFSYSTIIAFKDKGGLTISENEWGPTTGKHLNWIDDDKSKRITREEFKKRLSELLRKYEIRETNQKHITISSE